VHSGTEKKGVGGHMKRLIMSMFLCALVLFQIESAFSEEPAVGIAQVFAFINGKVGAGIICDNQGHMFVCKNGELLVVTPKGEVSQFTNLSDLPKGKDYYFPSPLIWSMAFDRDGSIVAAAQDRILRIAPDGSVATPIREDFDGFIGASGIAVDKDSNLYVTSGSKVLKYTPKLEKSVFIDASSSKVSLTWEGMTFDLNLKTLSFLSFDPKYENLYVSDFDSETLLKYPILNDGRPGTPIIVFDAYTDDLSQAPLNVLFGESGSVYASNDISSQILKVDANGRKALIRIPGKMKNHIIAFGGKGFDEESIYFTTLGGDFVYRFYIGERSALPSK
jgi:sugar lactone lactonase YvrE